MSGAYYHSGYHTFHIYDPKHRIISKARVRDRLVHHVIFKRLYQVFDESFIYHSYSSRIGKGTHLAVRNLAKVLQKLNRYYPYQVFALKCDIKKFFASVSHQKLLQMIQNKIKDSQFLWLVQEIIGSFSLPVDKDQERERELRGLPIGNLTSQIFANIYLSELDQFIKHGLRVKHYFRYADDFIIVHQNAHYLESLILSIREFLKVKLDLELHPQKVTIRKLRQGIDFLGYVVLPHHVVLRTKTKKRMFRKLFESQKMQAEGFIDGHAYNQSVQSYLGMLKHCNGHRISTAIKNNFLR